MKIAAAQITCALGDVPANCAQIAAQAQQARDQGCDAIVFPEMTDTGYEVATIQKTASAWPGAAFNAVQEAAAKNNLHVFCGMSEVEGRRLYNTLAVFDPSGKLIGKYRKAHLFSPAPVNEDRCFKAGDALVVVHIGDWKCGLMICYDLRFPEQARALALKGAEVLVIASAWQFPRVSHWNTLLAARAIENQAYVVAANRTGTDGAITFCGSSRIMDPYGVVVTSAAEDRPQLITGELSRETLDWVRGRMPVFRDRRPDLY